MIDNYKRIIKDIIDKNLKVIVANNKANETNYQAVKFIYEENIALRNELERINQENYAFKRNWIPCAERLPDPRNKSFGNSQQRVEVIVCQRNGIVKEMLFEFATKEFWESGDTNPISHWKEDENGRGYEVVAWQSLPEPYKEIELEDEQ